MFLSLCQKGINYMNDISSSFESSSSIGSSTDDRGFILKHLKEWSLQSTVYSKSYM